jgi:predicted tellurium resistance membrane protein TerC
MIINSFNDKTTPITFDWQIIPLIAVTDLAFSLDSVTTVIALSDQTWLILIGGMIGVIALRFLAEIFVQWLNQFTYLQDAAYLTIFWVGIRLY